MVWAIVVVAIAVLGAAAWAGTGRLGEMPEPVSDRPKGRLPEGPVDRAFLDKMVIPGAAAGYRRSQVDDFLAAHVDGDVEDRELAFDVVRGGYDMQVVDSVLERMHDTPVHAASDATSEVDVVVVTEEWVDEDPQPAVIEESGDDVAPAGTHAPGTVAEPASGNEDSAPNRAAVEGIDGEPPSL